MNIVLGATGQLGVYLCRRFEPGSLRTVSRAEFNSWISGDKRTLEKNLSLILQNSNTERNFIYYCVGETNSHQEQKLLAAINFEYPLKLVDSIQKLPLRMVTFGSVHELTGISNPYMDSKKALFQYFLKRQGIFSWTHFQLHTLYSEIQPKGHTFLGQILESLRQKRPFQMTSGSQIRQFHHGEDIAKLIVATVKDIDGNSVEQISGPETIRLKDLAEFLFGSLNLSSLLRIGALEESLSEVYASDPSLVEKYDYGVFRETRIGVLAALMKHLA